MNTVSRKLNSLFAVFVAAAALAGCAATQQGREPSSQGGITPEEHQAHHPQGAAAQPSGTGPQGAQSARGGMMDQGGMMGGGQGMMGGGQGMMGQGGQGMMGQGGGMDMKSMCDMHQKMMNARTPQERAAMMDRAMGNMSPEMRQRHLEMMEQHCR